MSSSTRKSVDPDVNSRSKDISRSPFIKCVAKFPDSKWDISNVYKSDRSWQTGELTEETRKQEAYVIFDLRDITIHSVSITMTESTRDYGDMREDPNECGTIQIYTSTSYPMQDATKWDLLGIKEEVTKEEIVQFDLQHKHKRYIRFGFSKIHKETNIVCIESIVWKGFEPTIADEITNKIAVYQTSSWAPRPNTKRILLSRDPTSWEPTESDESFIIFDCGRYEIDRIQILFKNSKSKPHIVKVRLSEICNAYSFRIPSIKRYEFHDFGTNDLFEEIVLNTDDHNVYQSGFKRYLQLTFSKIHMSTKLCIVWFRFFGKLSQQIPENSEQFDALLDYNSSVKRVKAVEKSREELDEKKEDDTAPYRPKIFKNSPPSTNKEQHPITNIWNDRNQYFFIRLPGFIIIDSGNNKIDEIVISSNFQYICSKGTISTSDDPNDDSQWTVLHDNDQYHLDEAKPYNISNKHKKYIKLEFDGSFRSDTNFYGIKSVELRGQSRFLTQINTTTLEEIKNMKIIDKDLVARYLEHQRKEINIISTRIHSKGKEKALKADPSEYWVKVDAPRRYMDAEPLAYTEPTVFEQEERLKIAAMQKQICIEYAMKKARAISNDNEAKKQMSDQMEAIQKERDDTKYSADPDQDAIVRLQKQHDEMVAKYKERSDNSETDRVDRQRDKALETIYKDTSNEQVHDVWKEAIEQHPLVISDSFNVSDYQAMIEWAGKYKSTEMKKLWYTLLDLFDESLEQRKILLHKYFIFVLSGQKHFQRKPKEQNPCWILLDCGQRKVDRIAFRLKQSCWRADVRTDRIEFYSANELKEEQIEQNGDIETQTSWSNFKLINHVQMKYDFKKDQKEVDPMTPFEHTRCQLNGSHQRYLRVVFKDEIHDNGSYSPFPSLTVRQMRAFVESTDEKELDEDEANGLVPNKYRLKLVGATDTKTLLDLSNRRPSWNTLENTYALNKEQQYESPRGIKETYFEFDCGEPLKKVKQIAIQFVDAGILWAVRYFLIFTYDKEDSEWTPLFRDFIKDYDMFVEKYTKEVKMIDIECKNQKYLRLVFVLHEHSNQYKMQFLKFCTVNVDENIKNLTSKLKVVEATPSKDDNIIDNIYHSQYRKDYVPRILLHPPYKHMVAMRIRDEVCRTVNQVRGGGNISHEDKQFVKGLLCWKNNQHYHEILNTSKRMMNLLSKTLIEEYKRLQDKNAKLLTLCLDGKHALPKDIVSNHGLLEWDYNKWYQYRKAFFYPNDLKDLAKDWNDLGLPLGDAEFKHLRRSGILDKAKSFVASDQLAMEYLNLIAYKLDPSFQQAMKDVFEENRKRLNLLYPTGDDDLGVLSGPVKTKARQNIKVKLDYYDKPPPQCMAVLDIVRCAVVCETDDELCSLFELINTKFSGKILRVKNAFDAVEKGTYGYRAVLMNIAYGDEGLLPKGYQMICEVQLLLLKYYQVRKNMHLGYGIVRSEEGGLSHDRQPYVVLAEDSCKFGKLDI